MQLALESAGGASASRSAPRVHRALAAGVAVAGAGLVAVNPVAPVLPLPVEQHAVQLTGTFDEAWANLTNLADLIAADPNPIGSALGDLMGSYGEIASTSIQDSLDGIEGIWSGQGAAQGLETLLPIVSELIADGNITEAYSKLNTEMLFDMLNVFQPLFTHTPWQSDTVEYGLFSLGGTMMRDLANLQDVFSDFGLYKSGANAVMSPAISAMFALADHFTDTGDHVPQGVLDAFLNGYMPWGPADGSEETHGALIGLLTERGPIDFFFNRVPNLIADALTENLTDADLSTIAATEFADPAGLGLDLSVAELFGDTSAFGELFADGSIVTDLFADGSVFTDLFADGSVFTDLVASLFG